MIMMEIELKRLKRMRQDLAQLLMDIEQENLPFSLEMLEASLLKEQIKSITSLIVQFEDCIEDIIKSENE